MNQPSTHRNPSWWNDSHSSGWERTKEALRRDWEQTKADVSNGGKELNQDVGDTIKQAAGKQVIPPGNASNPPNGWDELEPAMRYGYGARQHYQDQDWNDDVEGRLRKDWEATGERGPWDGVKAAVRRGWDSVKRAVS